MKRAALPFAMLGTALLVAACGNSTATKAPTAAASVAATSAASVAASSAPSAVASAAPSAATSAAPSAAASTAASAAPSAAASTAPSAAASAVASTAQSAAASAVASAAPTAAASAGASAAGDLTEVSLQLQWVPQAQFAGYFAADRQGFYEAQGLKVNLVPGGPTVDNQTVGSGPNGPEFTVAWVPKVLALRDKDQSDLVDIAQVFQRTATREISWKDSNITSPADWKGKKVGMWDFGDDYEVLAAARRQTPPMEAGTDFERVIQDFNMSALLNRDIDTAEGMIYNEYAQLLEAKNPATGNLYQPSDFNVIDFNDPSINTAMLQDALWARAAWLAEPGNEDIAVKFLTAAFQGWQYCRDHPADCVQYVTDAGSTLGAGHQAWMMNEINPLIWPAASGIGDMPVDTWDQTAQIMLDTKLLTKAPGTDAYRTDLAAKARTAAGGDVNGASFTKGTVQVTAGGE